MRESRGRDMEKISYGHILDISSKYLQFKTLRLRAIAWFSRPNAIRFNIAEPPLRILPFYYAQSCRSTLRRSN